MRNSLKTYLILIVIFLLNSCSSLSREQCLNQDWFRLGESDALRGKDEPETGNYRRECSQHGLQIKSMEYLKGFEAGLKKHCTYDTGLRRGEFGLEAHSLCEEANPEYKEAYKEGFREFKRKESIAKLKEELIEANGGKECSFDSECTIDGDCRFGKCEKSGNSCSFDSDCPIKRRCDSVSANTDRFWDRVSVNVCKDSLF